MEGGRRLDLGHYFGGFHTQEEKPAELSLEPLSSKLSCLRMTLSPRNTGQQVLMLARGREGSGCFHPLQ